MNLQPEKLSPDKIPEQMRELTSEMRHKALDIGNDLIERGYDLQLATTLAAEEVKEWVGLEEGPPNHHVIPHPDGWAIIRTGGEQPSHVMGTKQEAVDKARDIAKNQKTTLIIHGQDGLVQSRQSYG